MHVGVSVCCELLMLLNMAHTYGLSCMQNAVGVNSAECLVGE